VSEQLARTRETGSLHAKGVALRTQGQILAAQQRWDEAARNLDAAIARLDELDSQLELGRAYVGRAWLRKAQGQPDAARADAQHARALFARCGAPRDDAQANHLLETLA
jgi:tetratricopeptide (TPR) repeat protein